MIDKAVEEFLEIATKYFYKTTRPLDWSFFMQEVLALKKKYSDEQVINNFNLTVNSDAKAEELKEDLEKVVASVGKRKSKK